MRRLPTVRRARHRRRRTPLRARTVLLRAVLPVALVAALLSAGSLFGPRTTVASAAPQPYSGTCPAGTGSCVQVSLPCAGPSACPTVVVGPTSDLLDQQYVYFAMSNFPAGDFLRVAYCATDGSGTIVADPYCGTTTGGGLVLKPQTVLADSSGSAIASAAVAYDPSGQDNTPVPAIPLVYDGGGASSFFCDNGPDYCSFVVTDTGSDPNGTTDTQANTVVIPLNFSLGATVCPASDPTLNTDSAFTVEHLIPAVDADTCSQSNGVVAVNTATNTASEITDLASGGTSVAFTDDPLDQQLLDDLPSDTGYAYIPVALSATVVAFRGSAPSTVQAGQSFPVAQYEMTPNMVAGVLTTTYADGGSADNLVTAPKLDPPPLDCADLVGCNSVTAPAFNTFDLLNPEPPNVGQPGGIGSFFSNTVSGTNYQLSDWMCAAPNAPFTLSLQKVGESGPQPVTVTDTYNPATATFTTPPVTSPFWDPTTPPSEWPFKSCQATSQFPTLNPGGLQQYTPSDTPALQAKSIIAYGSGANIGFGAMDWSEAAFNGLHIAALQNASGAFVTPSAASIDAALSDASENQNGIVTFSYNNESDTGAYPMPMVTYALVPLTPLPATQAKVLTNFLTNMVDVSSGKTGSLPGGYVPLTPSLATQALSDIANDIVAEPSNSSNGAGSSGAPATGANGGNPSSSVVGSSNDLGDSYNVGASGAAGPSTTATTASGSKKKKSAPEGGTSGPASIPGIDVIVAGTRYALPVIIALAIATVIAGPVLLTWPRRRRVTRPDMGEGEPEGGTP
jgi:hypothetical protein